MVNTYDHIFMVGDVLVSPDIINVKFCCDLDKCHGQCCIEGDTGHRFRRELVMTMLKALIIDMSNVIYRFQQVGDESKTRAEVIFHKFIQSVEKNYRTERRVGWYAQQLCITSKYLSETVRSVSRRTPSEWIDSYVTRELLVMLRNTTMSIKQIAEELNFANQSFLGKYFKEHVGVSPSRFRKG